MPDTGHGLGDIALRLTQSRSLAGSTHSDADISRLALSTVFCSSMVMVIGPTPPGTGVMKLARCLASWKATSPTNL